MVSTLCSEAPTAKGAAVTSSSEPQSLDHRDINRDLDVFATDALVGSGLPLWLPAGAPIRHELEVLADRPK